MYMRMAMCAVKEKSEGEKKKGKEEWSTQTNRLLKSKAKACFKLKHWSNKWLIQPKVKHNYAQVYHSLAFLSLGVSWILNLALDINELSLNWY